MVDGKNRIHVTGQQQSDRGLGTNVQVEMFAMIEHDLLTIGEDRVYRGWFKQPERTW